MLNYEKTKEMLDPAKKLGPEYEALVKWNMNSVYGVGSDNASMCKREMCNDHSSRRSVRYPWKTDGFLHLEDQAIRQELADDIKCYMQNVYGIKNPKVTIDDHEVTINVHDVDYYITNVIFNDPATIVFWSDGTKTVVKCCEDDIFDEEKELLKILKSSNPESIRSRTIHYSPSSGCNIGIVRQPFTDVDDLYWTQFGIKRNTLTKYNVFSIRYFLLNNTVRAIYKNDCPMYAYKVNNHFKIYRPLAPKQTKWRNNMTQDDIQGFNQLDLKDKSLLIITKSMKDVMVLREMGYNAISPSSETTFISNNIIDWCKKTFKHVLLLFDRDKTGVQRSRKFSKEYGLDAFLINKRFKAKDISDAVKINGFNVIKNWLDNTLTKYKND